MNLRFAKNIFFYSLPEDPAIFKEMIELIGRDHYIENMDRYEVEDKFGQKDNYAAVIALYSKFDKYNAEKILGTDTVNMILKKKLDNYVC